MVKYFVTKQTARARERNGQPLILFDRARNGAVSGVFFSFDRRPTATLHRGTGKHAVFMG